MRLPPREEPEKKQSNKQERKRRKRARRKRRKQIKAANSVTSDPLLKSVSQGAVGDRQDDAMNVDLETEDQGQEQDQGQRQGEGQRGDGGEERKLTARERVMLWQLDNGKMPVGSER